MSHSQYLNFEVALEEIVEHELPLMHDSVTCNSSIPELTSMIDDDKFQDNLIHGFIALAAMCDYLECCVNSIIRIAYKLPNDSRAKNDCLTMWAISENDLKELIKKNLDDKLERMRKDNRFSENPKTFDKSLWDRIDLTRKLRNDLIHFKAHYMQEGIMPTPGTWFLDNTLSAFDETFEEKPHTENLANRLSAARMRESWEEIRRFVQILAELAGCMAKPNPLLIEADARDGFALYFVNKQEFYDSYPNGVRF